MPYWEFLLQKEGEQSWQALKNSSCQIEEGNYRIVAQSSLVNTEVEIIVRYTDAIDKSQTKSKKFSSCTNTEGMINILPFNYLKSGIWELVCRGDILDDLFGEFFEETFALLVSPISVSPPQIELLPPTTEEETKIILTLDRDTFVKGEKESIVISGKIESSNVSNSPFKGIIYYELREPQTGEVLLSFKQELLEQPLPVIFSHTLAIPPQSSSCLILGEVILEVPNNGKLEIIQRQSFSIAAKLEQILNRVVNLESVYNPKKRSIDLPEPQKIDNDITNDIQPSTGLVLPPKISNSKKTIKTIELPPYLQSEVSLTQKKYSIDRDFQALKLKERFWSRLNSLAQEESKED